MTDNSIFEPHEIKEVLNISEIKDDESYTLVSRAVELLYLAGATQHSWEKRKLKALRSLQHHYDAKRRNNTRKDN